MFDRSDRRNNHRHFVLCQIACLLTLLAVFTTADLCAQVETGKIVGSVKDPAGAVVANASVTVTEVQTNVEKKTTTNSNGEYVVTELKSGNYVVSVEHPGFKKAKQTEFKLDVNQVVRVDFTLALGAVNEEIVVTSGGAPGRIRNFVDRTSDRAGPGQ